MVGFLLFSLGVLFLGIAFVLWRLSKVQMINLAIRNPLSSEQEGKTYFTPLATLIRKKITLIIQLLSSAGPLLILITLGLTLASLSFFSFVSHNWIGLIFLLFLLSLLVLISFGIEQGRRALSASLLVKTPISRLRDIPEILDEYRADYTGDVILPKKVHAGTSKSISIELKREHILQSTIEEAFRIHDKGNGKSITLQIWQDASQDIYLEVELQAAAFTVDGEKKQRCLLSHPHLPQYKVSYRWNCYFPNSGDQVIALIFRVINATDVIELGVIPHTIKVVQADHLTQQQVQIFAWIGAIAGFLAVVVSIVTNMPTLLHLFGWH